MSQVYIDKYIDDRAFGEYIRYQMIVMGLWVLDQMKKPPSEEIWRGFCFVYRYIREIRVNVCVMARPKIVLILVYARSLDSI
jgi:hypothetical protein